MKKQIIIKITGDWMGADDSMWVYKTAIDVLNARLNRANYLVDEKITISGFCEIEMEITDLGAK